MDTNKAITILEALASGYSPTTGEIFEKDHVLKESEIIRALQLALNSIKDRDLQASVRVEINEMDILSGIQLFKEIGKKVTPNRLVDFFLASNKYKDDKITGHELYGKFKKTYKKGQMLDFFENYAQEGSDYANKINYQPWNEIDFFQKETFNRLSEKAINQLKDRVLALEVIKTEKLTDYVIASRINYPRAYESWSDQEKELLKKAMEYTNNLDLLSSCFQRGKGAIESCGKRFLYEQQINLMQKK